MSKTVTAFLLLFYTFSVSLLFSQEKSETWDFIYPKESNNKACALNLRYLNEKLAGDHSFIKLSKDCNSFVRGDEEPIRFWPVNISTSGASDSIIRSQAKFLAQNGVNMFRYHAAINPKGKKSSLYDFDMEEIKNIWRYVSIMKQEGIYATISPFWPHNGHMGGWLPNEWGINGYSNKDDLWGVFYFNDTLRMGYKNWVRALYTLTNPYTGIPLKDEPAIAIIQILNEDGVFFWTMQNMKPELERMVVTQFIQWLETRYGSLTKAYNSWGNASLPGDNINQKKLGLYSIWDLTQSQTGDKAKRMKDQAQFYAETQYRVYEEIYNFYKHELGCKQLINATNWITASPSRLLDMERWTNTACEVLALNRYYDPGHFGENNGWRIDPGHYYIGESALLNPAKLPINIKQVNGHPFIITESGWNTPHKYMAEGPFLISSYESLSGIDAFYWFSVTHENYDPFPYFEFTRYPDGQYAMNRWTCSLPGIMAQFPANAFIFRKGYLKPGQPVITEKKSLENLFNREESLLYEDKNFDPNRDKTYSGNLFNTNAQITALSFLAGTVKTEYTKNENSIYISDKLPSLVNIPEKTIKSITGEQELDYGNGICIVKSDFAKGVCGFLSKKNNYDLEGVTISTQNKYAAIWIVSLDEKPLKTSEKILIQFGTTYKPTGWQEQNDNFTLDKDTYSGYKILNTGKMPWQAENTMATIGITNNTIQKAYLLDVAGYVVKNVNLKRTKNKITIELPLNTLYLILEK
jgi:hypothetical protein